MALRSEHYQAIDKLMGFVRATFPNDRTKQDLVFPVVETAEETPDDGESEKDGP